MSKSVRSVNKRRSTRSPDPFMAHEALDRAHVVCTMFCDFVEGHPFVKSDPVLRRAAEKVSDAICDFYQLVGQKSL